MPGKNVYSQFTFDDRAEDLIKMFGRKPVERAMIRALVKTKNKVRTQSNKIVRSRYTITLKRLNKRFKEDSFLTAKKPKVILSWSGRRIGLLNFLVGKPKLIKVDTKLWGSKRRKLFVRVRKDQPKKEVSREGFPGFIGKAKQSTADNQINLIFRRTSKERGPVKALHTLSVPEMLENARVHVKANRLIGVDFPVQFDRALLNNLFKRVKAA